MILASTKYGELSSGRPPKTRVLTRGRSTCPSPDRDLDLFIGRDGIAKLLAESFGEKKRGGWSTFIVG